jgi:predicted small lipoprotein YifL
MTLRHAQTLLAFALAAFAAAGCGIKGPLTLPEEAENIVIRAPGAPAPAEGSATEPAAAPATTEESATAQPPAKPKPDRPPPPPLPSSNPGTGHGG